MAGLETSEEMFDLRMSEGARLLFEKVKAFIVEEVEPITLEFHQLGVDRAERWSWAPGQLELLDSVKAKAKANDPCRRMRPIFSRTSSPRRIASAVAP